MPHTALKPLRYERDRVQGPIAKRQVREAIWLAGPSCDCAWRHSEHFGKRVAVNIILERV